MTRTATPDPAVSSLRTVEQLLAGAVFIGAVAALSLPGLGGAVALWLPLLPLARTVNRAVILRVPGG